MPAYEKRMKSLADLDAAVKQIDADAAMVSANSVGELKVSSSASLSQATLDQIKILDVWEMIQTG